MSRHNRRVELSTSILGHIENRLVGIHWWGDFYFLCLIIIISLEWGDILVMMYIYCALREPTL